MLFFVYYLLYMQLYMQLCSGMPLQWCSWGSSTVLGLWNIQLSLWGTQPRAINSQMSFQLNSCMPTRIQKQVCLCEWKLLHKPLQRFCPIWIHLNLHFWLIVFNFSEGWILLSLFYSMRIIDFTWAPRLSF